MLVLARIAAMIVQMALCRAPLPTSATGSWREPARCAGERFESAAGRWLNALWPLRDRPCRDVSPQRGGTSQH